MMVRIMPVSLPGSVRLQHLRRRLTQLRFGVDQEFAGGDYLLAGLHTLEHLHHALRTDTGADGTRLELAGCAYHVHLLPLAGTYHGLGRDHDGVDLALGMDGDVRIQVRLQQQVGIVELQPYLDGACLRFDIRVDVADLPAEHAARNGRELHLHRVAGADPGHLVFVHVCQHPDPRQVGQHVELGGWRHVLPLARTDPDDHAVKGRMDMQVFLHLA
jgi:hypothetical protein